MQQVFGWDQLLGGEFKDASSVFGYDIVKEGHHLDSLTLSKDNSSRASNNQR